MSSKNIFLFRLMTNGICGILMIAGIFLFIHINGVKSRATVPVAAEIVSINGRTHETKRDGHRTKTYMEYPVLRFEYNGKPYEFELGEGRNRGVYHVGGTVNIKINPDNPTETYRDSDTVFAIVFIVFPLVMMVIFNFVIGFISSASRSGGRKGSFYGRN